MWEKLKLVSATNEINYYWILFVSTENSYSLTVTDLLNVWIQECDEDDISIRQNVSILNFQGQTHPNLKYPRNIIHNLR